MAAGKPALSRWETELRAAVAIMRELGVVEYNGIRLGDPPPSKEVLEALRKEREKAKKDPLYEKRAHYTNLLGAVPSDEALARLP